MVLLNRNYEEIINKELHKNIANLERYSLCDNKGATLTVVNVGPLLSQSE